MVPNLEMSYIFVGINDDTLCRLCRLLDPIDEDALLIGLAKIYRQAQFLAGGDAIALNIGQALCAIDARLASAEHIEIGAVEDEDGDRHDTPN